MKKVLVTGALGYLGSVLCQNLKDLGYHVIGLDTGFFKDSCLGTPRDPQVILADMRAFDPQYLDGIDAVIHLAAVSNDPFGKISVDKIYDPTRCYAITLARLCKQRGIRFIFPSSCSVYGQAKLGVLSETSQVNPQTPYSLNKLQIESDLLELSCGDFLPIILRFATVYGPSARIRFDLVVNMLTAMAFTQKEIVLNSDGKAWRPHVHIEDVCQAFRLSLEFSPQNKDQMIFNVGDDQENFQIISVAQMIQKKVAGSSIRFMNQMSTEQENLELIKDRKIHDGVDKRTYQVTFKKINEVMGFKSRWSLEKGIQQLLEHFDHIGLTKEQFLDKKYYRLQQIEYLHESGLIDDDLFWTTNTEGILNA